MNRKVLWDRLVAEKTTIKNKTAAKGLLRWLWKKNRVRVLKDRMGGGRRCDYLVNERVETKFSGKEQPRLAENLAKEGGIEA